MSTAQQESIRAKNDKERRITEAEAAAAEVKLRADADAYQVEKSSVAKAAAIQREAAALASNPQLLQLRAAERWDGKLPVYMGGQQPVPFISVGQVPAK